jgi:hypothetical protein
MFPLNTVIAWHIIYYEHMRYDNKNTLYYFPLGHISFTTHLLSTCPRSHLPSTARLLPSAPPCLHHHRRRMACRGPTKRKQSTDSASISCIHLKNFRSQFSFPCSFPVSRLDGVEQPSRNTVGEACSPSIFACTHPHHQRPPHQRPAPPPPLI